MEPAPEVDVRLTVDQIKSLVGELARAPRDSPEEAAALVTRIHASLDALLKRYWIR